MSISITLILIIMTSLISYQATNNPAMMEKLIFRPASIKNGGDLKGTSGMNNALCVG